MKANIAYVLFFVFASFIVLPTLVTVIDEEADISYVFNLAEEEENSSNSSEKKVGLDHLDKNFFENTNDSLYLGLEKVSNNFIYLLHAQQIYFDLLSPPPEFHTHIS
ncbi:MAG: hypothetical protein ACTJGD_00585 [Mesonia hippocampi]|uniref:hypothetical protein n=1 Tax=Mesonia hippocampi TaxID=1628250 RepID=UPI003F992164